jgi:hypothetical protein
LSVSTPAAKVTTPPSCPYCSARARYLHSSAQLYNGRDFGPVWACLRCRAWVGCHKGTMIPLGRLADAHLRRWKRNVHAVFDPIWEARFHSKRASDPKYTKAHARGGRYKRLAELMGIPRAECHIGMFDAERCKQAIAIIESGALEDAPTTDTEG